MTLYVENTEPAEEIYYVEIMISPYPVKCNYNPFADVISITQPEHTTGYLVLCSTQNISQQMRTM